MPVKDTEPREHCTRCKAKLVAPIRQRSRVLCEECTEAEDQEL